MFVDALLLVYHSNFVAYYKIKSTISQVLLIFRFYFKTKWNTERKYSLESTGFC